MEANEVIKMPTVGRIVFFYPCEADAAAYNNGNPWPAIVVGIGEGTQLTLNVFTNNYCRQPVLLRLNVDHISGKVEREFDTLSYWDWPQRD